LRYPNFFLWQLLSLHSRSKSGDFLLSRCVSSFSCVRYFLQDQPPPLFPAPLLRKVQPHENPQVVFVHIRARRNPRSFFSSCLAVLCPAPCWSSRRPLSRIFTFLLDPLSWLSSSSIGTTEQPGDVSYFPDFSNLAPAHRVVSQLAFFIICYFFFPPSTFYSFAASLLKVRPWKDPLLLSLAPTYP